jgi:hypothetical protein
VVLGRGIAAEVVTVAAVVLDDEGAAAVEPGLVATVVALPGDARLLDPSEHDQPRVTAVKRPAAASRVVGRAGVAMAYAPTRAA